MFTEPIGGERVMVVSHDDNAATEAQQLLTDDTLVLMVNVRPIPLDSIQLIHWISLEHVGNKSYHDAQAEMAPHR